jgi:hypothetical protein
VISCCIELIQQEMGIIMGMLLSFRITVSAKTTERRASIAKKCSLCLRVAVLMFSLLSAGAGVAACSAGSCPSGMEELFQVLLET